VGEWSRICGGDGDGGCKKGGHHAFQSLQWAAKEESRNRYDLEPGISQVVLSIVNCPVP